MSRKKGSTYIYLTIIGIGMGIVLFVMARIYYSPYLIQENFLGESQLLAVQQSLAAENLLIYTDTAAKIGIYDSLYSLAGSGGSYGGKPCGDFHGYALWDTEKQCPSKQQVLASFKGYLRDYLNKKSAVQLKGSFFGKIAFDDDGSYTIGYDDRYTFPQDNYDIYLEEKGKGTVVYGIAAMPVVVPIIKPAKAEYGETLKEGSSYSGLYETKPSFTHTADYSFTDYDKIMQKVAELKEGMSGCVSDMDEKNNLACPAAVINKMAAGDNEFGYFLGCNDFGDLFREMLARKVIVLCLKDKNNKIIHEADGIIKADNVEYRLAFSIKPVYDNNIP